MRRFLFALALLCPVAAHAALPCSAYPNTLTNGTLADANQVMANFNTILNCVNSLAPLGVPAAGTESNVKASLASAGTSVTFTADSVILGTALNGTLYTLTSYNQTFNSATVGAGGMDTGTLPTSSYVAIYAIYNPTAPTVSILGTTCAVSCPTIYAGANMPAGYTASALLGVWPTNATPAMVPGYIKGKRFEYQGPALPLSASSTNQASLTSLSLVGAVPPNAIAAAGQIRIVTNASFGGGGVNITLASDSTNAAFSNLGGFVAAATVVGVGVAYPDLLLPTAQTMFYATSNISANATATITVSSYLIP